MTTTLYLVRHGETIWHAENRYAGSSDVALSDLGREQAVTLSRWAATTRPDRVVSSPLSRALLTATPSAEALGLGVDIEPDLREVDFGRGEGLTRAEMQEAFGEDLARFHEGPARHPLPGAERGVDAIGRARPALDRLVQAHRGGSVLVVAHSTLLRLLICDLVGIDPDDYRRVLPKLENVAVTTVRVRDAHAQLLGLNVPPY